MYIQHVHVADCRAGLIEAHPTIITQIDIPLCTLNSNFIGSVHAPILIDAGDDHPALCREGEDGSEVPVDNIHWSCSEVSCYLFCTT